MTEQFLKWLIGLIANGDIHPFYVTKEWRKISREVLHDDKHECQICKARGKFRKAVLVHHVNGVKRRPDLALSRYCRDEMGIEQRNLISVCKTCHETECHPERLRHNAAKRFYYPERWD